MLRGLLMIASSIVLVGVGIAVLQAFDWDIGAVITWAYEGVMGLVNGVANFLGDNPTFQKIVSS